MSDCASTVNPALQRIVVASIGSQVDLQFKAGTEPDAISYELLNPDGSAVDLTGVTGVAKIRKSFDAATVEASFVVSIAANTVTLSLPVANSNAMASGKDARDAAGQYVFDHILTFAGGVPKAMLYGNVTKLQAASRA